MKIIGLTGGSGSGKGEVGIILSSLGAFIIDTDKIYHDLCIAGSECLSELVSYFSDSILNKDGSLNRKLLGSIVFLSEEKRNKLNEITHKYILAETKKQIQFASDNGYSFVIVDAPLLFESGFNALCSYNIFVRSETELRIRRICERDGIDRENAVLRIKNQPADDFYISKSDYIIENNGTLEELRSDVISVYKQIGGDFVK